MFHTLKQRRKILDGFTYIMLLKIELSLCESLKLFQCLIDERISVSC